MDRHAKFKIPGTFLELGFMLGKRMVDTNASPQETELGANLDDIVGGSYCIRLGVLEVRTFSGS